LLASTLNHETVGHAFYAHNRTEEVENYEEPFYTLDQRDSPELGLALKHSLWGTYMNAIIYAVLAQAGMLNADRSWLHLMAPKWSLPTAM
jgi:hypothetical protein